MAQQIKKKYIGADQIDSTKIKLLQGQAIRVADSTNATVELIKLGASDEVLVKGEEVATKNYVDTSIGAIHEGAAEDYTVSTQGGVSRITFLNDIATGGASELVLGDSIYVTYQHE